MSDWLQPTDLSGHKVKLVPLATSHTSELSDAASDGELWNLWYTSVPTPDGMSKEIDRRLKLQSQGSMLPFTVLDSHGVAIGMTTFMNVDANNKRVEIGSTWYAKRVHRSGVNTEAKLLLMTYAFEVLECIAVEFRTSYMNRRSRRAIERLGAKLDGVLRSHCLHCDGTLRDTCVYSVIQSEWNTVKRNLIFELNRSD